MTKIQASELIINNDGSVFHLHIKPGELADKVILVGDPARADLIATKFDTIEVSHSSREFHSVTGTYKNTRFTALSTGIGCDNIDIVMNELDALVNIDFKTREIKKDKTSLTVLRIGTCGGIQPYINLGDLVFSHISVGCDGLMNWYADRDAISELDIEKAFVKHVGWSEKLPAPYFVKADESLIKLFEDCTVKGMTISASGFYGPQGRVLRMPLAMPNMVRDFESFEYDGRKITNFEMEGSAIAGIAKHLGHKAGTMCTVVANRYAGKSEPDYHTFIDNMIQTALDKMCNL